MKKVFLAICHILISIFTFGQVDLSHIKDSILKEGKKLYRSEFASWYGTDIFLENYKGQRNNIGGYFSYADNENEVCVFFSNEDSPKVLGTITFDKKNTG